MSSQVDVITQSGKQQIRAASNVGPVGVQRGAEGVRSNVSSGGQRVSAELAPQRGCLWLLVTGQRSMDVGNTPTPHTRDGGLTAVAATRIIDAIWEECKVRLGAILR